MLRGDRLSNSRTSACGASLHVHLSDKRSIMSSLRTNFCFIRNLGRVATGRSIPWRIFRR